ncbi:hypothetical protein T02_5245 [Trichinella nativa]|uniref:Uncharacterized protein n=3 Tax=Trichinella TaxID=6333 RepID=A0A0V1LVW5_9BILA|nr:hypothetical protein T05_12338 [Trichinella murrelli]KRY52508.1 hypothetical protein T03_5333 [Trichinella britovi]KRZ49549.1 hypothetical protein T02_5469 [Trichinella nativa]KRZ63262.1 hypothetical protein T02_5245 [Trichinella nativa]KRZ90562.1 hypothetical protein T08_1571 [Trichinella sp. T8]
MPEFNVLANAAAVHTAAYSCFLLLVFQELPCANMPAHRLILARLAPASIEPYDTNIFKMNSLIASV